MTTCEQCAGSFCESRSPLRQFGGHLIRNPVTTTKSTKLKNVTSLHVREWVVIQSSRHDPRCHLGTHVIGRLDDKYCQKHGRHLPSNFHVVGFLILPERRLCLAIFVPQDSPIRKVFLCKCEDETVRFGACGMLRSKTPGAFWESSACSGSTPHVIFTH